jgi:protein SMG6
VPGYTVLVLDTNILLSSLSMVTSLVESLRWTVVVPLPAIMELDGLGSNATALGEAAKGAIEFIASHVRSHSDGLKVQTSWGNYLSSLSVRAEQIDFDDPDSWERSMDDLILKAAIWQDDHWVNRSALLKVEQSGERSKGVAKVVLLSLDRNRELSLLPLKFAFSNAFGFVSSPQGASMTSCLDAASGAAWLRRFALRGCCSLASIRP